MKPLPTADPSLVRIPGGGDISPDAVNAGTGVRAASNRPDAFTRSARERRAGGERGLLGTGLCVAALEIAEGVHGAALDVPAGKVEPPVPLVGVAAQLREPG